MKHLQYSDETCETLEMQAWKSSETLETSGKKKSMHDMWNIPVHKQMFLNKNIIDGILFCTF
jgi:hypothetical protein